MAGSGEGEALQYIVDSFLLTYQMQRKTYLMRLTLQEGDDVLEWATGVAGGKLITCYMHDVKNTMQLRELNTGAEVHKFPLDIGSVTGFSGDIRYIIKVYLLLMFCYYLF